jgi:hypothetical protein
MIDSSSWAGIQTANRVAGVGLLDPTAASRWRAAT